MAWHGIASSRNGIERKRAKRAKYEKQYRTIMVMDGFPTGTAVDPSLGRSTKYRYRTACMQAVILGTSIVVRDRDTDTSSACPPTGKEIIGARRTPRALAALLAHSQRMD